ncbi:NAD(P)-dependent oxidoreductase [Marinoscillum furvescens]|uniref:D-3-phosphoglycerate dehydrogenase n=1 Tax=Marinoscillum furvescens DSM 4134 TaxID=1122208 RepID=A0A3D9L4W5_MARFU|nr:NAD(P)-dependent oxidoreductase [Marinoscillum furvescens]REE01022.1 D-3-phosphoglycerate dehydrogenase [Marinoscillum furvescens DSM 4134]
MNQPTNNRVLIVDQMHDSVERLFTEAGFEPDYRPDIKPAEVLDIIHQYGGVVVRSKMAIDKSFLDAAVNLRFVARAGAGIDKIDYPYLTEKGVKLVNAPEGNRDALGEHAIGMLLNLFHRLDKGNREVRDMIWDREGNRGFEVKGKTIGIFGFGFMGSAFAEKLRGFSCRVLAYDKYKTDLSNEYVEQVDLETFFREVEILSIHVPLTAETRFLFDEAYLERFQNLKVVVNTSRGEVLKLSALNKLLAEGKLLGAALDVLENEKLKTLTEEQQQDFDTLRAFGNVILSPHVGGWTFESYERINEVLVSKLQAEGLAHV